MARGKKQAIKVETPDIEIVVRVGETELAVCSFFGADENGWDVLVGIDTPTNREPVALALSAAAEAVRSAAFHPLPTAGYEGSDNPPF